jgi:hypothetical protein
MDDTHNEKWKEDLAELIPLIEKCLVLKRWGFALSYQYKAPGNLAGVIYNSEKFRISIRTDQSERYYKSVSFSYGRLHATNDFNNMVWNGEKCRCWHNIVYALPFLDGLSPEEAIYRKNHREQFPDQYDLYNSSEIAKRLSDTSHRREYVLKMEGWFWDHYGDNLFDLFDLHRPELWERYRQFLKEYKRLLNYPPIPGDVIPDIDQVC